MAAAACTGGEPDATDQVPSADGPNIIVINVDDADLDLLGREAVETYFPNIDRHLLTGGMHLDNLHVVAPLCGPKKNQKKNLPGSYFTVSPWPRFSSGIVNPTWMRPWMTP